MIDKSVKIIKSTGHNEISFSSLSTGDYSQLNNLLVDLSKELNNNIKISLPSLRLDSYSGDYSCLTRTGGITFAPKQN